ncbi:hypothetical protein GCM10011529_09960 [Polymorphobacter glacialis]|uniref:Uncharacterized protein n=1 Tax=Sandarakinorhabdus glacialis TaxID=1614636 RepID=A0A917E715_9SPHN|nr:hypothetical protein [Polymorphobacter glacialis]GGE05580.1 hypothetical protein GCM10011529_09960 [Polymorphobacter glacialis]
MMAKLLPERVEAAPTAPTPNVARFTSKAVPAYPDPRIGSTEYAARIIGARCRLSPAVANSVIELVGMGGDA